MSVKGPTAQPYQCTSTARPLYRASPISARAICTAASIVEDRKILHRPRAGQGLQIGVDIGGGLVEQHRGRVSRHVVGRLADEGHERFSWIAWAVRVKPVRRCERRSSNAGVDFIDANEGGR